MDGPVGFRAALAAATFAVGVAACSGSTTTTGSGGGAGAGASSSGGTGTGGGSATGGSGSGACGGCIRLCEGGVCSCSCPVSCEGFARPTLDKSCTANADCFADVHVADCCGSLVVLGYNIAARSVFDTYESDCQSHAVCDCLSQPPTLENGTVTSDVTQARAVCVSGQCLGTGPVNTGTP
jgi:hypothetical protein